MPAYARTRGYLAAGLLLALVALSAADVPVPALSARVTDLTNTLTPAQRATLERDLQNFEARKGTQVAVLIVPTTKPETIEQYGIRVAETWKLGRKGTDDGVLLLVAKDDRELRIDVGYGLEGAIPDAIANRVVDEIIVPYFRQGDFYGGIEAGVARLIRLIEGESLPPPEARDSSWSRMEELLPIAFIAVLVLGPIMRTMLGRLPGAGAAGGIVVFMLWLLIGSFVAALIAGVIVFLFTLLSDRNPGRGGRYYGGGGFRGGFGGAGGGFRGGGGGFGGGGASGRW